MKRQGQVNSSSVSSDVRAPTGRHGQVRSRLAHGARWCLIAALVWLIHDQHRWQLAQDAGRRSTAMTLDVVRAFFPAAELLAEWDPQHGGQVVKDAEGETLGFVVQTSPHSDRIVGYSGPTNVLMAFDHKHRALGIFILDSRDTPEHVAKVLRDPRFLTAFDGRSWDELSQGVAVDTVSGATLTSWSIVEGIAARVGGSRPGLRFPEPIKIAEVRAFFPVAERIEPRAAQPALLDVLDSQGERLGTVLRTSPAADDRMGYQGPTDTLIAMGLEERIVGITLRNSYDNQPYVGYVRDDEYFRSLFNGKTLAELSKLESRAAGVEGVSGATMTSQAIADGLSQAAKSALQVVQPPARRIVFGSRDVGTVSILLAAMVLSFSRLRGIRWLRISFQLVLVGYFGFLNGDLLSQAQLVGWAQSGVPWRLAPGLALLTAVSLVTPAVTKKQLYCHHICPFGAAQQLVKLRLPTPVRFGKKTIRLFLWLPTCLLCLVFVLVILRWSVPLASLEPFDAFVFWIAGSSTIAIAIGGLGAALFVPMAYCRFGCPTGALLNYARFHAQCSQFTARDLLALILLVFAGSVHFWR